MIIQGKIVNILLIDTKEIMSFWSGELLKNRFHIPQLACTRDQDFELHPSHPGKRNKDILHALDCSFGPFPKEFGEGANGATALDF